MNERKGNKIKESRLWMGGVTCISFKNHQLPPVQTGVPVQVLWENHQREILDSQDVQALHLSGVQLLFPAEMSGNKKNALSMNLGETPRNLILKLRNSHNCWLLTKDMVVPEEQFFHL